jgi:CubicO group peptidase (beta-lactamase class C family)
VNSFNFIHYGGRFSGAAPDIISLWQPATIQEELTVRRCIWFLASFVILPAQLFAQSREGKIDALLQKYFEYDQFTGSALVAEEGTIILKKGYGCANLEWGIPNAPDTKFRLGSITKQFTSMLVMQQVEKGSISLDTPVAAYLPDYPKPQGEKVTIRHLLTHTSGIPNYTGIIDIRTDRKRYTLEQLVGTFSGKPLEFEPGTRWKYSNSGYVLLGAVLEKVTRTPYERLLQSNILHPLGMKNTGYDHSEEILPKRAAGYERTGRIVNAPFIDMSVPFSAGALYSTVEDLLLWDRGLYTGGLLSDSLKKVCFTPVLNNYAFGWVVQKRPIGSSSDSALFVYHGGGINGFNTIIARIPARQQLIVLLNNTGNAPLDEIVRSIAGILYDRPYAGPRQSIAHLLGESIGKVGVAKALEKYAGMIAHTGEYSLDESEMNILGYQLLQGGKTKEAIEVFKLNVAAFPKSWNVYDSLGEAYMKDGEKDLAIANYEKSLELNGSNSGAVEALKKLKGAP